MITYSPEETIYLSRSEAEAVAARLNADDPAWEYQVRKAGRGFVIAVYDNDGVYMGNL